MKNTQIKKCVLFVGLFDKDTKTQKIDTVAACNLIQNIILSNGLDGATISNATGLYKHDGGQIIIEPSVRVELLFATDKQIKNICTAVKNAPNQESVTLESQIIESRLV